MESEVLQRMTQHASWYSYASLYIRMEVRPWINDAFVNCLFDCDVRGVVWDRWMVVPERSFERYSRKLSSWPRITKVIFLWRTFFEADLEKRFNDFYVRGSKKNDALKQFKHFVVFSYSLTKSISLKNISFRFKHWSFYWPFSQMSGILGMLHHLCARQCQRAFRLSRWKYLISLWFNVIVE